MVSAELLQKFKEIYRDNFGEDLSDAETLEKALTVVNIYQIILEEK